MNFDYAIIVKSKTRLELLIERFNTKSQAKFYIESLGGNFQDYVLEDENFKRSLEKLQTQLTKEIKNKTIDREYLPTYLFSNKNLIVVIGQDGLVANTAKYSNGQPIIGVNPDQERYDGVLLPFDTDSAIIGVRELLNSKGQVRTLNFAQAELNDGQKLLGFNDLFIGPSSHVSARYKISFKNKYEEQSSSGLIVSTQAGSSGWLSSIFNMAYGVTGLFEKDLKPKRPKLKPNELLFSVREPFKSIRSNIDITAGIISGENKLIIESFMPNYGVIFSDGIEKDFLNFNSGSIATIGLSKEQTNLVINTQANTVYS